MSTKRPKRKEKPMAKLKLKANKKQKKQDIDDATNSDFSHYNFSPSKPYVYHLEYYDEDEPYK